MFLEGADGIRWEDLPLREDVKTLEQMKTMRKDIFTMRSLKTDRHR